MNSPHNFDTLPSTNNNNLLIIVGDNNGVAHSANHHSLFFLDRKPLSFFYFLHQDRNANNVWTVNRQINRNVPANRHLKWLKLPDRQSIIDPHSPKQLAQSIKNTASILTQIS